LLKWISRNGWRRFTDGRGRRLDTSVVTLPNSRFLHYAVARAPSPVGMTSSGRGQEQIKSNVKGNGQECPFHTVVASLR